MASPEGGGGGGAAAAAAPSAPVLEFGWVPAEAVRALLEEVGNFKARAAAVEVLHTAVLDASADAVLPTLSAFFAFLLRLVGDPNFKIAVSAMTILEDLVAAKLGADVQPYLGTLAEGLTERLGDNVQMVRRAAAHALAALARAVGPAPLLVSLGGALAHSAWRVREEGVNAHTAALLAHSKEAFDYPACVRALAGAAADETPRVATAALEAFAVLHARLGVLLQGLLTAVGAPEGVRRAVTERVKAAPQLGLPALDVQGHVVHQAHARPASARSSRAAAPAEAVPVTHKPALAADPAPLQLVGTAALPSTLVSSQPAAAAVMTLPPQPAVAAAAWAGGMVEGNKLSLDCSCPQTVALAYQSYTATVPAAGPVSAGSYAPAAAAAAAAGGMECSVTGAGYGWPGAYSSVPLVSATQLSAPAEQQEGKQEVERSDGSLLSWTRPGVRRPVQQSFSSSTGATGAAGAGARLAAAAAEGPPAPAVAGEQQGDRGGAIRSFLRSAKPPPAIYSRSRSGAAPALGMRPLPLGVPGQPALLQPLAAGGAHTSTAGAYNADLYSSVRNWQQQQGDGGSIDGGSAADGTTWQQDGLAVEARSGSLFQWRLPAREQSSRRVGPALPQQQPAAAPAAASPLARIGSAALKSSFNNFKKRIFGREEAATEQQQQQQDGPDAADQQQPGSPGWSIAAVHTSGETESAQSPTAQQQCWPSRPGLTVSLSQQPEPPDAKQQLQPESPESPGKAGDRLNRLRQMSELRRVWSAPLSQQQHQPAQAEGWEQLGSGAGPASPGTSAGTVPGAPFAVEAGSPGPEASTPGQRPPSGSPGTRPGLQALKARARTARMPSSGSSSTAAVAAAAWGSTSVYYMDAVNDVFGPDLVRSPAATNSPVKLAAVAVAPAVAESTTPKLTVLTRSGASGGLQWPDSPTSASSPSRSSSLWKGGSLIDAALAAKPAPGAGPPPSTASGGGFSPSSDTSPLPQPDAALRQALAVLQSAAASQKKELDWQAQYEALRTARRLARHHPAVLSPALHAMVLLVAPVVDALRSTSARMAIAVFQELAETMGPSLDPQLDVFVPLLLKRAGQVSVAGRDNFLAVEADHALAAVVGGASEAKAVSALLASLASKSPDVRAKAALHLDACLQQRGPQLMSTPGAGAALVPRLLRSAVGLLDEGGLEARTAGKRMLWMLRDLLDGGGRVGEEFKWALGRLDCKTDKVWDVLEAGRIPAAPVRLPSAGLRATSALARGSSSGPPSPGASSSYSPAKPSILTAAAAFATTGGGSAAVLGSCSHRASSADSGPPPGRISGAAALASRGPLSSLGGIQAGGSCGSSPPSRRPSRPPSGRAASAATSSADAPPTGPSASLAGLDPDLQQRLETAGAQLGSREWKERLEGIEALQAAVTAVQVATLPPAAQAWVADALAQRVADPNLKVQQQALTALNAVLDSGSDALSTAAATLLPAVCKALDSGNPSVRQASCNALDAVLRAWATPAYLPPLMAALATPAGAARGKALLLDLLVTLVPELWQTRPALIRKHVLSALFALLMAERRPELRQMVRGALAVLAQAMGAELTAAAVALPQAQHEVVAGIVAAQRGE